MCLCWRMVAVDLVTAATPLGLLAEVTAASGPTPTEPRPEPERDVRDPTLTGSVPITCWLKASSKLNCFAH